MKLKNIRIEKIAASGHGVVNIPAGTNKELHVLGAFPGDLVDVEVYKTVKHITFAELVEVREKSDLRLSESTSEEFSANSPWLDLSHEGENSLKLQIFNDSYPEQKIDTVSSLSEDESLAYRNKVAYSFLELKNKKLAFALHTRGVGKSKKVEQESNPLVRPELEKIGKLFLHFFNQKNLVESDLKYLILRYSYSTKTVVAHLLLPESNRKKLAFKKVELENFLNRAQGLQGIVVSHSAKNVRSAQCTKDFYDLGDVHLEEELLGKKYSYHPSLFFQIYPKAFELILKDMRSELEKISEAKKLPLLDLFSGVGIIGIELADLVSEIKGVELSTLSGTYARRNAKANNVEKYSFYEKSVDEILEDIQSDQILVLDPTRAGVSEQCTDRINLVKPEYIFYVSCNPETQAEDIEEIESNYEVVFSQAYNIFPKTHHIESLIILKKK